MFASTIGQKAATVLGIAPKGLVQPALVDAGRAESITVKAPSIDTGTATQRASRRFAGMAPALRQAAPYAAVAALSALTLAGCAPHANTLVETGQATCNATDQAGFLLGFWHGTISFFTYIASIFTDDVSVYEVCNNGFWYNAGFLLGIGAFTGGSSGAGSRAGKKN